MKIAVDVTIGPAGIAVLEAAGHQVVYAAEEAAPDRDWFNAAIFEGAELFISTDSDIEILAYDHNVEFFHHRQDYRDYQTALALVKRLAVAEGNGLAP